MTFWAWLKANVSALLATAVAVLGAGILWQHHKKKVRALEDLLELERAQERLYAARAQRQVLAEKAEASRDEIARLDAVIVEAKREIVGVHEDAGKMNTSEILEAFDRLGYK